MATYDKEIDYANSKVYLKLKERSIYGSSRVGVRSTDIDMLALHNPNYSMKSVKYEIGKRTYELSNHLGNVLSVISDKPIPSFEGGNLGGMLADVRVAQDYSPFGVTLSGRNFEVDGGYRYGFGGQEKDDEVSGKGNSYTAEFWQYSPRLGRRWNLDPVVKPNLSGYSVLSNNPILMIDPNGDTDYEFNKKSGKTNVVKGTESDGPDRIIRGTAKYNKDGELKNWKFKVHQLEGKIENLENSSGVDNDGDFNYQTYTFSNSKDGEKVYNFMAHKTNIEISKSEYELDNDATQVRFFTSGNNDQIRGEYLYMQNKLIRDNPNIKLLSHVHNHGNPGAGKLGSYSPSDDDEKFAGEVSTLFKINGTKPKFYVWRFGSKTQYDNNGIVPEKQLK